MSKDEHSASQTKTLAGQRIETDKEGYLRHLADWSRAVAESIAVEEGITLTDEHWQVIEVLREFYQTFDTSPAMRPFVKYIGLKLGKEKANSIYLLTLFPPSPAKIASKIAGLPRPTNCL
ncbi:TusE/DsrC/DsvC family sulfur relay protein [Eionea flava]